MNQIRGSTSLNLDDFMIDDLHKCLISKINHLESYIKEYKYNHIAHGLLELIKKSACYTILHTNSQLLNPVQKFQYDTYMKALQTHDKVFVANKDIFMKNQ